MTMGGNVHVEDAMFTSPNRLHITIGVMHLMDDDDRAFAKQLLEECQSKIVK